MITPPSSDWGSETLTVRQTYLAMYQFLDHYWQTTKSDEIAGLLGGLSFVWSDDTPGDPAYKIEWQDAVRKVLFPN
jgi:hypothetical protein